MNPSYINTVSLNDELCYLQEARGKVKDLEGQVENFMKDTFSLTQDKAKLEGELKVLEEKVSHLEGQEYIYIIFSRNHHYFNILI